MLSLFLITAWGWTPADCPFGVNAHQAPDQALELAADAGVAWVRFDMNWNQFEPAQGVYDWTVADRFVATAAAEGLQVFVTVAYTPSWAGPPGCDDGAPSEWDWCRNAVPSEADWTAFLTAAITRYGDQVKHWGMWNEPNLAHFFRGSRDEYVDRILIPGSEAVHAACPDCRVLGPELANLRGADWDADAGQCLFGECVFNGWEVSLREILREAGPWIDIVSHHKYADPAETFWSQALDGEFLLVQYMHGIKEITDENAPGVPVWITEMGWESTPGGPHSPTEVADELYTAYAILPEVQGGTWSGSAAGPWPELERVFWYDLTDDPNLGLDGQAYTWGLLDADLLPKPAWTAYADVVADLGGCADPVEEPGGGTGTGPTPGGGTDPGAGATGSAPRPADEVGPGAEGAAAGCGCAQGSGAGPWGLLALLGLGRRRPASIRGSDRTHPRGHRHPRRTGRPPRARRR